jgi:hypothetical protein
LWKDFDIELARAVTISYEQLLKDYLDHPSEQYEVEYPEFKVQKTVDIHPPKTGISVHFSDVFILMALQN